MIAILGWIIFGLIAGVIAKASCQVRTRVGDHHNTSGYCRCRDRWICRPGTRLWRTSGRYWPGFIMSLVFAVIGAIIVLAVYRLITAVACEPEPFITSFPKHIAQFLPRRARNCAIFLWW